MQFQRFILRSEDIATLEGVSLRSGQMRMRELKAFLSLRNHQRPSFADYARWRGWDPEEVIRLATLKATLKR